jgi:hypothetical protein
MRAIVERSFPADRYEPRDPVAWTAAAARFDQYSAEKI